MIEPELSEAEALETLFDAVEGFMWFAETAHPPCGVLEIDLGECELSDDELRLLKYFPKLEWICLEDTGISDFELRHLMSLTSLKCVELSGTSVSEQGIAMLHQALPGCEIRR